MLKNRRSRISKTGLALAIGVVASIGMTEVSSTAQSQPQSTAPALNGRDGRAPSSAYPIRPPADPAEVERGKQLFGANCSFCHGPDARGGEGGPNLLRSEVVLDDQNGEAIEVVVQNGRSDRGMPKFELSTADVTAIAAFIHSFPLRGAASIPASDILVGDAKAGEAYFNGAGKCTSCHSVTGDLAGVGAKYDPRTLETRIVMPGRGRGAVPEELPPTTVRVTLSSGGIIQGKLNRIDDFSVSLTDANGDRRTFARHGDSPKVDVNDPLQAHKAMWQVISDNDIHNLTAYLATLK